MLAARCAAVEFSFDSFVLGILLSGGGDEITVAGEVTVVVSSSSTASLCFLQFLCTVFSHTCTTQADFI